MLLFLIVIQRFFFLNFIFFFIYLFFVSFISFVLLEQSYHVDKKKTQQLDPNLLQPLVEITFENMEERFSFFFSFFFFFSIC